MGADYSFYVKTIETHARAFFKVIIFSISSVTNLFFSYWITKHASIQYYSFYTTIFLVYTLYLWWMDEKGG